MKYGESTFDILYLLFAMISGCELLYKAKNKTQKRMGAATLILGCGDAFHLIPRVLNYFVDADFTVALGVGKLVTSVTMTVFYLLLLSFSDFISFGWAYLLAAVMTSLALTAYFRGILRHKSGYLLGGLAFLFLMISFGMMQMQVYSLLTGSLLLFAILCVIRNCYSLTFDCNSALTFNIHVIKNLIHHLAVINDFCLLNQTVRKG